MKTQKQSVADWIQDFRKTAWGLTVEIENQARPTNPERVIEQERILDGLETLMGIPEPPLAFGNLMVELTLKRWHSPIENAEEIGRKLVELCDTIFAAGFPDSDYLETLYEPYAYLSLQ